MELITLKRETKKNPREMLLELFANDKETFIVIMSNDWFNEFCKCKGVGKDYYELNSPNYNAYFIHEGESIASKCVLKIKVDNAEGSWIITEHSKKSWNSNPAKKIYYFEWVSS